MSVTHSDQTRITYKKVRPNPLFQDWLQELYEEAKEKGSKLESMLKTALESLSKYPLPLQSGAECIILKGFEKKLCMYLDKRLEAVNYNSSLAESANHKTDSESEKSSSSSNKIQTVNPSNKPVINENGSLKRSHSNSDNNIEKHTNGNSSSPVPSTKPPSKKKTRGGTYKPTYRSGGYAILITLLEQSLLEPDKSFLTKENLIEKAQKYSEESFVRPKPNTFYTAWSSMSKLISKKLVSKARSKKVTYSLTDEGKVLAGELKDENDNRPSVNDIIFKDVSPNNPRVMVDSNKELEVAGAISNDVIELDPGSFDIILLIDKNETGGLSKKNDPTVAQFNKYPDLKHEYRSLKVGDFTWIARSKINTNQELVLPYVIERKRMDDLGASIKDGRFHEQKFRLRKCGLKNVIYMVENYGSNKHVGLPIQNLMQALANTRVQNGFKVHITDSLTNSARFLAMLTKRLTIRYKDKNLRGHNKDTEENTLMTFEYFNKSSAKTKPLTVTETFLKLLLQLKGMSVEKALAITNKYSTPRSLITAYQRCDQSEGEYLVANLKYGDLNRNVGPVVSKSVYQLFTTSAD